MLTLLAAALAFFPHQQPAASVPTDAIGSFEVKMAPTGHAPDPSVQSFNLDKTYHGGLEATAKGEMLSSGDPSTGNAGYVAIERVTGTLDGKTGSFALMHNATMIKGSPNMLNIIVVPGSGTGELSGIYGTFTITIAADGKHIYTLRYAFAAK